MLPSSKKLSTKDVLDIMKNGRIAHSQFFVLRWVTTEEHTRFAVIIPKKIIKTAAGRNKIKRPIYNIIQEVYPKVISGLKVALFIKVPTVTATLDELESDIKAVFLKNKFIK